MSIGRNDLCPCGSGKKYKKCCINKVEKSSTTTYESKKLASLGVALDITIKTSHEMLNGVSELCLGILDTTLKFIARKSNRIDAEIFTQMNDLKALIENQEDSYINILREVYEAQGFSKGKIALNIAQVKEKGIKGKLNENEKSLLQTLVESVNMEYAMLTDTKVIDYSSISVVVDACYKAIISGVSEENNISMLEIFVDTNDLVKDVKVSYTSGEKPFSVIFIWNSLDEFYKEKVINNTELSGLSKKVLDNLTSVEYLAEKYNGLPNKKDLSYTNIVKNYLNIIETEARQVYGSSINSEEASTQDILELLWKNTDFNLNSDDNNYISEIISFYKKVEDVVSFEEFNNFKKALESSKILHKISDYSIRMERQTKIDRIEGFIKNNKGSRSFREKYDTLMNILNSDEFINYLRVDSLLNELEKGVF